MTPCEAWLTYTDAAAVSLVVHQSKSSSPVQALEKSQQDPSATAATLVGMSAAERAATLATMSPEERAAVLAAMPLGESAAERAATLATLSPEKRRAALAGMPSGESEAAQAALDNDLKRTSIDANGDGMLSADEFKQLHLPERFDDPERGVLSKEEKETVRAGLRC